MLEYRAVFYLSDSRVPNNGCLNNGFTLEMLAQTNEAGFQDAPDKSSREGLRGCVSGVPVTPL